jgi:hypothetical protein
MLWLPTRSIGGGGRLVLITALLHFLEMEPELELLGYVHNVDLPEGQMDAL